MREREREIVMSTILSVLAKNSFDHHQNEEKTINKIHLK